MMRWIVCLAGILLTVTQSSLAAVSAESMRCNSAIKQGEFSQALQAAEAGVQQNRKDFDAWVCKGRALSGQAQYAGAMTALQTAQKIADTPFQQAVVLALIGGVQKNSGQMEAALETYQQTFNLAHEHQIKRYERIALNMTGEIQAKLGQWTAALESYQAGLKLSANDGERGDNFSRIANIYRAMEQWDQAIEYQIKASIVQEAGGDLDSYADTRLELGRVYTLVKMYEKAEKTLQQITQFSKDNGGAYFEAKGNLYLAQLKIAMGDSVGGKILLANAEKMAKSVGDADLIEQVAQVSATLAR